MSIRILFFIGGLMFAAGAISAQTTLNPDLSAVGDFRAYSHNDKTRPDESEKFNLADPAMEINVVGYLNPYARADMVVGWEEGTNADIEEVYATILRGLPLNANLRVGKYLLEFGRLNSVHPHAYSFIKRPLVHEMFFGEEGLSDMAVRASFLLPTGNAYTEIMGAVLKGDALIPDQPEEGEDAVAEESESAEKRHDPGFFGRVATSVALSDVSELALGTSVLNEVYALAEHDEAEESTVEPDQLRAWVFGGDAKFKSKPSRYRTFQIEGEFLARVDKQQDGGNIKSYGGYGYLDYRFRQKYNVGGIFERVSRKESGAGKIIITKVTRTGLFVGFAPVEETSLVRLAGHYTEPDEGDGFWELTLQLIVSLGPHKPHNF